MATAKAKSRAKSWPADRTRLNTTEAMRVLGIPCGSKVRFYQAVGEAGVTPEQIGKSRTFDRAQIAAIAAQLTGGNGPAPAGAGAAPAAHA